MTKNLPFKTNSQLLKFFTRVADEKDVMKKLKLLLLTLILISCAKEQFSTPKDLDTTTIGGQGSYTGQVNTGATTVRPPVDFLFLWDNSTSSVFIDSRAKTALNNIINSISDRFDYNVLMAPIIGSGNSEALFFSRPCSVGQTDILDRDCTYPGSGITTIHQSTAASAIDTFSRAQGSYESGVSRAVDLIAANQSNGVFREGAYTIVVMMSNDDDNSWVDPNSNFQFDPYRRDQYIKGKSHDLLCMRGNYDFTSGYYSSTHSRFNANCSNAPVLNSLMMRFITVAALFPQNTCGLSSYLTENYTYKNVSKYIYSTPYGNNFTFPAMTSAYSEEKEDSYNICRGDYSYVFDSINNTITDALIAHVYRYLPLAAAGVEVDPASITVTRSDGASFSQISDSVNVIRDPLGKNDRDSSGAPVNGFRFINGVQTVNTRFIPTAGEPFTGQVVELFGEAKLTYPQSMVVQFQEPASYYGYVHLANRPDESEIELKIDGSVVPPSSISGWTLLKDNVGSPQYYSNFNIKIISPTNFSPKVPGDNRTGYFLRLTSDRVYSNNQTVEVKYSKQSQ